MTKQSPRQKQRRHNRPAGLGMGAASTSQSHQRGANDLAAAKRQYERYLALARAATLNGDAIAAQNCYQHAEHFLRTMMGQEAHN
jgi:Domain of unknown function (DUF4167)